jgi:hypothetical protein
MAVQVSLTFNVDDADVTAQSVMTQVAGRMSEISKCIAGDKKIELVDFQAIKYEIEEDTE